MASDILTLNAGSSSLKFSVWRVEPRTELLRGEIEKIGIAARLSARDPRGHTVIDHACAPASAAQHFGDSHLRSAAAARAASRMRGFALQSLRAVRGIGRLQRYAHAARQR
jgi:acetate kinase